MKKLLLIFIMLMQSSYALTPLEKEELIIHLFDAGIVRFGDFELHVLDGTMRTPIYIDCRLIISHPELFKKVTDAMFTQLQECTFDCLCGVPVAAVPLATSLAIKKQCPMIFHRAAAKNYGTGKIIEGSYKKDNCCALVEDVLVSGASCLDSISILKTEDLIIKDIFVFFDRQQGAVQRLTDLGYIVHAVLNIDELLTTLYEHEKISAEQVATIKQFIQDNQTYKQ